MNNRLKNYKQTLRDKNYIKKRKRKIDKHKEKIINKD